MMPCKTAPVAILTLCLIGVRTFGAEPAASPLEQQTVRVIGLRLADPALNQQRFQAPPLPGARGSVVHVLIRRPDSTIVGLDRKASDVTTFADSRGNNLRGETNGRVLTPSDTRERVKDASTAPKDAGDADDATDPNKTSDKAIPGERNPAALRLSEGPVIAPQTRISDDGSMILVTFRAPKLPAANAEAVHLQAQLQLRIATGRRTRTARDVPLKPGPLPIESEQVAIAAVEPSQWASQPLIVRLKLKNDSATRFAGARFVDRQGKDVTARRMPMLPMANVTQVPFALTQQLDRATVKIDFFDNIETVTVPFDVQVGVSLRESGPETRRE